MDLFTLLGLGLTVLRNRDHGAKAGGNAHALATDREAGFLSARDKKLLRRLEGLLRHPAPYSPDAAVLQNPTIPQPVSPWRGDLGTVLRAGKVDRGAAFVVPAELLTDTTTRPGWTLFQAPADAATYSAYQPLSLPERCAVVLPLSVDNNSDWSGGAGAAFGLGQVAGGNFDLDNSVFLSIVTTGPSSWTLRMGSHEGGVLQLDNAHNIDALVFPVRFVAIVRRSTSAWQAWAGDGYSWTLLGQLNCAIEPTRALVLLGAGSTPNDIYGVGQPAIRAALDL